MNEFEADWVVKSIITWGEENLDEFLWRNNVTPYESVIAEIMLIRTPPEQVTPVYEEFLKQIPDVYKLSECELDKVKNLIRPLGLTWRAKMLVNLGNYVVNNLNGVFPDNVNDLKNIPGIGSYVAGAVLTFSFRKRAVLVDSNTVRFFKRFSRMDFEREARRSKKIYNTMELLTPVKNKKSVKFNTSFIDFMRNVCKPKIKSNVCQECILKSNCIYYHSNYN
ncbi:MAG: DNA glycosylase [Candidatus Woesearchaeota archaeon]